MQERGSSRSRPKNLRVQADIAHTFGPLLVPLAAILVAWGGFQLERSITNPLDSDAASILFGSVVLACGLLLVAFLLRSVRISSRGAAQAPVTFEEPPPPRATSRRTKVVSNTSPPPRPFHRIYIDETRVSR